MYLNNCHDFHKISIKLWEQCFSEKFQKQPPEVFYKKSILRNLAIFTGKHLLASLFHNVTGLQVCKFIKKRLQHRFFSVNTWDFLRTSIFENICKRLLLKFMLLKSSTKQSINKLFALLIILKSCHPKTQLRTRGNFKKVF